MGWVGINGETVHTQALNPNPVVEIREVFAWKVGEVEYKLLDYIHLDGYVMRCTASTFTYNDYKP